MAPFAKSEEQEEEGTAEVSATPKVPLPPLLSWPCRRSASFLGIPQVVHTRSASVARTPVEGKELFTPSEGQGSEVKPGTNGRRSATEMGPPQQETAKRRRVGTDMEDEAPVPATVN